MVSGAAGNDLSFLKWRCNESFIDNTPPGPSCEPDPGFAANLIAKNVVLNPCQVVLHPKYNTINKLIPYSKELTDALLSDEDSTQAGVAALPSPGPPSVVDDNVRCPQVNPNDELLLYNKELDYFLLSGDDDAQAGVVATSSPGQGHSSAVNNVATSTQARYYNRTLPTSDGSRTCFSKPKSEVSSISDLITQSKNFCLSNTFQAFVSSSGLGAPCFKPSPYLLQSFAHDKFTKEWDHLAQDSRLSIVFHGTSEQNILSILTNGLNPSLRSGQAFGPGEYFAKDPTISLSYCHGGRKMLVFLVVEPRKQWDCPPDYVVVANNNHQLPLGSVSFEGASQEVLSISSKKECDLARLNKIAEITAREANDAKHKATIIQLLFQTRDDEAAEMFQDHKSALSDTSKREIAMYADTCRLVDVAQIAILFPGLPEPMKAAERDAASIKSVDEAKRDATQAKEAFEKAKAASASSDQEANETSMKAKAAPLSHAICAALFSGRIDIASEKYKKCMSNLSESSKREVATQVHRLVDVEIIANLFPGLREP